MSEIGKFECKPYLFQFYIFHFNCKQVFRKSLNGNLTLDVNYLQFSLYLHICEDIFWYFPCFTEHYFIDKFK